jgi:hypothetical protein
VLFLLSSYLLLLKETSLKSTVRAEKMKKCFLCCQQNLERFSEILYFIPKFASNFVLRNGILSVFVFRSGTKCFLNGTEFQTFFLPRNGSDFILKSYRRNRLNSMGNNFRGNYFDRNSEFANSSTTRLPKK